MKEFAEKMEALLVSLHRVTQQESEQDDKQILEKATQQVVNLRKEFKLHETYVNGLEDRIKRLESIYDMLTRRLVGVGKTLVKAENDTEVFQKATQNRKKGS